MAKRRPLFESLEERLCMASPTLQTTFELPQVGTFTGTAYRASPIFVDIFNTGKDDFISVSSGSQLIAYAEGPNGTAVPVMTYQAPNAVADIKSTPIVVTDPTTGRKDLFAGMGRDETNSGTIEDGRVFGWDLQTGKLLPGWTNGQSTGINVGGQTGVYGALASGVLEGNGMPDLVVTSFSHNVTAFRLDGSQIWQWTDDDTILSAAAVGDIDRSGVPSVVVGGDSSASSFYQNGGWVNVLSNTGILKWRHFIPGEVTWSSPVLADLNNNGYLDIVIGTGLNYQVSGLAGSQVSGDNIYALDPFGNVLPGWPYATTSPSNAAPHEVLSTPAVADLLGNGQLDVIALDRAGYVHVIQPNGQDLPGFVGGKSTTPDLLPTQVGDDYASPIVADINGDGSPDIIVSAGPYLRAFDVHGNLIPIATTPVIGPGTTPETINAAAAVGNFDGGNSLVLAFVSFNPALQSRPDDVQMFTLPPSTLTPPWPMMRDNVAGVAVVRSTVFDDQFVKTLFNSALGSIPDQARLQPFEDALNSDSIDLYQAALDLFQSTPVRQAQVEKIYEEFLGRPADSGGLAFWTTYLASNTQAQMEVQIVSTAEFAQRAGNSLNQEIVQLYQATLGRTPGPSEVAGWVASNLPITSIALAILNSAESINVQLAAIYPPAFGPGTQNSIPADTTAAYAYDYHRGMSQELMDAQILGSGGQYAATNFEASYVRSLYRDILQRDAGPTEVAPWVNAFDSGSLAIGSLAGLLLNSPEARVGYVQKEFQTLLGRGADPGAVASLQNYTSRENVVLFIVSSPEFITRNGGTLDSYVQALYLQLGGIAVDPATEAGWVNRFKTGTPLVALAEGLMAGGLYQNVLIVNELFEYLPDESLGVLRSANLSPTAAGQPINPNPTLIAYLTGLSHAGATDEQVLSVILTAPAYLTRINYDMGIWRSPGIRN